LSVDKNGLIVVDEDGRTTREGVFASGDVVAGAKNVVLAVKYSKQVAKAMDEYLTAKRTATASE
ncbi:MAG: FAD-dependent oxidoreductase, partial [Selenomonadaceae bacterium]|nr:FAD-dependent oxidoreductase [Selenomonadaceae bacterium]